MLKIKVVCLTILSITLLYSQENSLNLYGSMGFGFRTGGYRYESTESNAIQELTKREDRYFSYGQGIKFDVGVQYFMMKNVALQAGFGYSGGLPGLKTTVSKNEVTDEKITTDYNTHLFGLKVMVIPYFDFLELMDMYVGVGTGFFWNSFGYTKTRETSSISQSEEGKIKSAPTLGLLGVLGAQVPLTDKTIAFGEIGFEQMSFKWTKKVIDKSELGNVGTEFYEKDAPNQTAPEKVPGSNWQIRFGVRFKIL
ncbi:MAG: hypothetical protein Q4F84_00520 [Fibrobacter sp.]|nr:hypothetical protein [Fibrobacter sp.]